MKFKLMATVAAGSLISVLSCAGSAAAQSAAARPVSSPAQPGATALDEVVVTARRREESIVSTPLAVTALSGEQLEAANVTSLVDIDRIAPSLRVSPIVGRVSQLTFTIRGMNDTSGLLTSDPAVGIYFADAIQVRSQGVARALFDIGSVQVLNGPQGTLFGRNLTGGAVLIEPKAPVLGEVEGYAQGTYGSYDRREFQSAVSLPLGDKFALRLGANVSRQDGYVTNLVTGSHPRDDHSDSFRVSLLFQPTDTFRNTLIFDSYRGHGLGGGFTPVAVNPAVVIAAPFGPAVRNGLVAALAAQQGRGVHVVSENQDYPWTASNYGWTNTTALTFANFTIKNIFNYRQVRATDLNGTGLPQIAGFRVLEVLNRGTLGRQTSDELQIVGKTGDGRLEYQAGIYYFTETGAVSAGTSTFSAPFSQQRETTQNDSKSIYAQFDYHLNEEFSFTGGVRYTWDTRQVVDSNRNSSGVVTLPTTTISKDFAEPTYTISLNYKPDDQTLIYLTNRRGYRSGGFNGGATTPAQLTTIKPEILTDFEFGAKRRGEFGSVYYQVTLAAFQSEYQDLQRNLVVFIGGAPNRVLTNAGNATIKGGEISATVVPLPALQLSGFVGYTDAKYDSSSPFAGIPFSQTPKWTYNFSATLKLPSPDGDGHLSAMASYSHTSSILITDAAVPAGSKYIAPGYGLLSARLNYEDIGGSRVYAALFATNLLDEDYVLAGTPFYNNLGFTSYVYGAPQMFGVELGVRF